MAYIFKDINVRDPFVSTSTDIMLEDTKVVVQSVWRLINTEEGEVPYFRNYGIDMKRLTQLPLNKENIDGIIEYIKRRIEAFEDRATIVHTHIDGNVETGEISMIFYLRVNTTGETATLPAWRIQLDTI